MSGGESREHRWSGIVGNATSLRRRQCNPDNTEIREFDDHMQGRVRAHIDYTARSRDFWCDRSKSLQISSALWVPDYLCVCFGGSAARCFDWSPGFDFD